MIKRSKKFNQVKLELKISHSSTFWKINWIKIYRVWCDKPKKDSRSCHLEQFIHPFILLFFLGGGGWGSGRDVKQTSDYVCSFANVSLLETMSSANEKFRVHFYETANPISAERCMQNSRTREFFFNIHPITSTYNSWKPLCSKGNTSTVYWSTPPFISAIIPLLAYYLLNPYGK